MYFKFYLYFAYFLSRKRKCLNKLLEYKADVNIRNNEGLTTVSSFFFILFCVFFFFYFIFWSYNKFVLTCIFPFTEKWFKFCLIKVTSYVTFFSSCHKYHCSKLFHHSIKWKVVNDCSINPFIICIWYDFPEFKIRGLLCIVK